MYYLKAYDTECLMASRFNLSEETVRKWVWFYIDNIQALMPTKVSWPEEFNDPNDIDVPFFICTVDGTHCQINEPVHPTWNKNTKYYSHKFKRAAVNYEIAIATFENKIVWVRGPIPAGKHDIRVFREELINKIPANRRALGDRGYRGEPAKISAPNPADDAELRKFRARAMSRHEIFNGRLKNYRILDVRFRHGEAKHKKTFEAVVVICIYQMELGNPLLEVRQMP